MAAKLELKNVKLDYDSEGDVLYIYFGNPYPADDSDVTDEGVVVRTRENRIVGLTILNARERLYL
ncbi:MAG: DUF2283 domain-containing protein [Chloroflexi bacterium]|nr:DUF2283 domain-containing protein [Chloroflexota bacterium]